MSATPAFTDTPDLDFGRPTDPADVVRLEVDDIEIDLLTGIYSEETDLPQPLRISVMAEMGAPARFRADTPLAASKNYLDLRHAVTEALPRGQHFTLVESIADHVAETLFVQDDRVRRVVVKIVKLAISQSGESIGITLVRHRC